MLLLGHMGITALASFMAYLPILGAIAGVLLPDIIDKGFFTLGLFPCGRYAAHSIFFSPIAGVVTYIVTKNKKLALAISLGAFLHLLEDMHGEVPFLFPFKDYELFSNCEFKLSFTPYIISMEVIGSVILISLVTFKSKLLYARKILWSWLQRILG